MFPRPRGSWLSVLRVSLDRVPLTFGSSCINMLLGMYLVCGCTCVWGLDSPTTRGRLPFSPSKKPGVCSAFASEHLSPTSAARVYLETEGSFEAIVPWVTLRPACLPG